MREMRKMFSLDLDECLPANVRISQMGIKSKILFPFFQNEKRITPTPASFAMSGADFVQSKCFQFPSKFRTKFQINFAALLDVFLIYEIGKFIKRKAGSWDFDEVFHMRLYITTQ